ncbi:hypothetical protein J5N97_018222 [Dioscorea zingiberensis]|uniref:C2 domain-containing protein n=1 Tax=Dioscorea zingiberensis TaxID=325984 RepID=A0A9D5CPT8_9LILI|nr:hypothetical protein J5N97_018222 [Dioscorea zingiberensis]
MASTTLEITLISAKDLEDVNLFSDMVVYAYVSIDGDSRTAQRTTADQNGGTNPSWNATVRVPVPADDPSRHVVHVILRTERALGDRDVGEVHIPLKEFFSCSGDANNPRFISYQVRKPPSWNPRGVLNLSFKISDAVDSAPVPPVVYPTATTYYPSSSKAGGYPPATSYPSSGYPPYAQPGHGYPQGYPPYAQPGHGYPQGYPPPPPAGYGCSAPPQGYGYGAVPAPYVYPQGYSPYAQPGYGYPPPPPPAGYGYGAVPPQQPQNKLGLRLFAAVVGDALGGLVASWMTSGAGFDF